MYSRHSLSAAFPSMPEPQFEELVEDIKLNGLREPVVLFENQVIDGWHRYLACQKVGFRPQIIEFNGEDPVAFVKSKNLHRRHLNESQRAMAVVACNMWMQKTGVPIGTLEDLAIEADVGRRTIARAKLAYDAGRTEDVMDGKVTLGHIEQEVKNKPQRETVQISASSIDLYKKQIEELTNEITALKDRNNELQALSEDLMSENEMMQRLLEEDSRFPAALEEIKNLKDRIRIYKEQMVGLQNQANEAMKLAKRATKQNARPSE